MLTSIVSQIWTDERRGPGTPSSDVWSLLTFLRIPMSQLHTVKRHALHKVFFIGERKEARLSV